MAHLLPTKKIYLSQSPGGKLSHSGRRTHKAAGQRTATITPHLMFGISVVNPHVDSAVKLFILADVVADDGHHGTSKRVAAHHGYLQRSFQTRG